MAIPKAINHVVITGNVGGDPTINTYTNEKTGKVDVVVDISLAVYGGKLDPSQPAGKDNNFTKWYNVRYRGTMDPTGQNRSLAEDIGDSVKKGMRITVSGRLTHYVKRNEDKTLMDHTNNDNVRTSIEGTDIVIIEKDGNGGGSKHELPPI